MQVPWASQHCLATTDQVTIKPKWNVGPKTTSSNCGEVLLLMMQQLSGFRIGSHPYKVFEEPTVHQGREIPWNGGRSLHHPGAC